MENGEQNFDLDRFLPPPPANSITKTSITAPPQIPSSNTGIVFTCGILKQNDGEIVQTESTLGKKIINVSGCRNGIFVLCDEAADVAVQDITFSDTDTTNDSKEGSKNVQQRFIFMCGGIALERFS